MGIKTYDLAEIPSGRARSTDREIQPYLDALKSGKGAGDGLKYESREEAVRAAARILSRARRIARTQGGPYPGQRIWQDRDGRWLWALVPVAPRGGTSRGATPRRRRRRAEAEATTGA
ncbi:MAG TPA: hypothetical protein VNJ28_05570 [Candidatus Limnocylindrales bacterium]|nr:hypothetical protein [Candidatus Limnocylindrales bacterium]